MATKIVTKNSSTASAVPTASDLVQGELAVNVADKRLFTEDNGGSIIELGTNPSTIDINAGSIDGTTIGASSASTGAFTTLTATGLTVDGNSTVDAITYTASSSFPTTGVTLNANGFSYEMAGTQGKIFRSSGNSKALMQIANDGDISFYEDTGTTAKFFWDASAESLGIGTSSPSYELDIQSSSGDAEVAITGSTTNNAVLKFENVTSNTLADIYADNSKNLIFRTNSTIERMRIDSSGNVGIGTSSPAVKFHTTSGVARVNTAKTETAFFATDDDDDFRFGLAISHKGGTTDADRYASLDSTAYRISTDTFSAGGSLVLQELGGNVGIGTTSPTFKLDVAGNARANYFALRANESAPSESAFVYRPATGVLGFGTGTAERMRIDASGNLLVGKSSANTSTAGVEARENGLLVATRSGGQPLLIDRLTNDGDLVLFRKDGSTVGSIGASGGDLYIGTGDTALRFFDGADFIYPVSTATGTARDNAIDLGYSTGRFDDIYATNGTIQTSDRNEKQDIAELSDAEQRVAVACKGLLRKFRWKDSVAEKGDEARTHFGIIAQDLQAAFAAEGLDAGDYAMFISTTWTDEETNEEKTRMGVRYSELLAFIISAI